MAWIILLLSGALETVWAAALDKSEHFSRRGPVAVFVLAQTLSLLGLAWAMREIPTGTAYAVWVGVGASLTVLYGWLSGQESTSRARVLLLSVLVASVVGLKVVS
ncbi:DMT family transporter [Schaalia turicensis]|uniref:DMT family transporter n=1 Tax=Schaalia turicensis TaxID=131111 RepID=UPI0036C9A520